jgi:hypothetical protein
MGYYSAIKIVTITWLNLKRIKVCVKTHAA